MHLKSDAASQPPKGGNFTMELLAEGRRYLKEDNEYNELRDRAIAALESMLENPNSCDNGVSFVDRLRAFKDPIAYEKTLQRRREELRMKYEPCEFQWRDAIC
eukprot:Blabericola_migrator_1__8214@NODE_4251_length_1258_cov_5_057935_g2629_i0_p3_GENE_NODE_4251_length_1258_cov_5_057935_g2629_i0NODE_4251_length_1258_cov_5_057935_g2629_i0_p3_ORF_typecomplete_len103_score13_52_NODE_4251_length_1258_cov_5_057935_g2629_i0333641